MIVREHGRRTAVWVAATVFPLAFAVGVKFSSAKPYNIWDGNLNYDDANGLAGIGTGVADYSLVLYGSKALGDAGRHELHGRLGLGVLGDPTAFTRGSSQADQLLYGLDWQWTLTEGLQADAELVGMWGVLRTTTLDHYSVARLGLRRSWERFELAGRIDRGLTRESDDWAGGIELRWWWRPATATAQ